MTERIAEIVAGIRRLEDELEQELENRRNAFKYTVEQRRVVFERDVKEHHEAFKQKLAVPSRMIT